VWSGLGYYNRVRNLQRAAQRIVEQGQFPVTYEQIRELPGVGDYTAAAIASIAYGLPHAVLDGNVMRVMARVTCDFGDIDSAATRTRLRDAAEQCLLPGQAEDGNQALMELGATVCLPRNPRCLLCPIAEFCKARAEGVENDLPTKLRRATTVAVESTLLVVEQDGHILLRQRPYGSPMAGFWDLPDAASVPQVEAMEEIHAFRHSIMNRAYRCTVYRAQFPEEATPAPEGYSWIEISRLEALPLSTMTRKALQLKSTPR
ncbi:MAG: NUDIX domain-containing protein, partial [Bryobacterales bacterium]|nr:NUDIX domain-containing protein [Bryobacterales bacterium]